MIELNPEEKDGMHDEKNSNDYFRDYYSGMFYSILYYYKILSNK